MFEAEPLIKDYKFKLRDGRLLGYSQLGDPDGKPLLYFHGGVSSRLDIAFAAPFCATNNIRLIAPDRPGIGLSTRQPDRTLLNWADDTVELLDFLQLDHVPLLGWSLAGAYVAACLYKYPERFLSAATIGGCSPILPPVKVNELGMLIDQWLLTCPKNFELPLILLIESSARLPKPAVRALMLNELSGTDREIVAAMSEAEAVSFVLEATKQGGAGIMDDYRAVSSDWGFNVKEISHPLTLWYGEEDTICPISMPKFMQAHMPYTTMHIVPGLGHFLLHRKFEEIARDLKVLQ
jgi:pimeloyl-ACP methyl ester carboxylesterase